MIGSSSPELTPEAKKLSPNTENDQPSDSQESDRKEADSIANQESKESDLTDTAQVTEHSESVEAPSLQLQQEERQADDTEHDTAVSVQEHKDEMTSQSEEVDIETESVSSNGQDGDSDSARASNDPRNLLSESVETGREASIQIS